MQVFQAQENRERAVQAYTAALNVDPFCYEAFQACFQAYFIQPDMSSYPLQRSHSMHLKSFPFTQIQVPALPSVSSSCFAIMASTMDSSGSGMRMALACTTDVDV